MIKAFLDLISNGIISLNLGRPPYSIPRTDQLIIANIFLITDVLDDLLSIGVGSTHLFFPIELAMFRYTKLRNFDIEEVKKKR